VGSRASNGDICLSTAGFSLNLQECYPTCAQETEMPIEFKCNGCQKTLRVPDNAAGLTVNCPECSATNRVPDEHFRKEMPPFPASKGGAYTREAENEPHVADDEDRRPCPMCGEM